MKRIIFYIFALSMFLSCQEDTSSGFRICDGMTFSDALPVQFWLADCETYNEYEAQGVHHVCWCAPWLCTDEILIQFQSDTGLDYELGIVQMGTYINQTTNEEFETDLTDWSQTAGASVDFEWSASQGGSAFNPVAIGAVDFDNTFYQELPQVYTSGTSVRVAVELFFESALFSSGSLTFSVVLMNSLSVVHTIWTRTQSSAGTLFNGSYSINETIELTGDVNQIGIIVDQSAATSGNQVDAYIKSIKFFPDVQTTTHTLSFSEIATGVYQLSITPNDLSPSICDSQAQLKVLLDSVEVAKSDCLDIATAQDETILIEYSNQRNFAGLIYENDSPDTTFKVRVPCRFFHESETEEDEAMELTSSVITTSAQAKTQRLLEVKHVPYYFHKKLRRVLKHQTITIGSIEWKKEEQYKENEGNKRWPLKSATCLLTEKNSVVRNVL